MPEVCFVTCARLPDLDADDRLALEPLATLGCQVTGAVWDDPQVDWERFDVTVLRSTWDYTDRRDDFVRWAQSVPRLLNPAHVVTWNTDKLYLEELAKAGVRTLPTAWITYGDEITLPNGGEYVVKPSVGAGSIDADRYDFGDAQARARAAEHVSRLVARGYTVMVQPFAAAIETLGEAGVILIDGEFSHTIRKGSMLGTSLKEVDGLFKEERIEAAHASAKEMELARAAVDAAVRIMELDEPLLYARVDMVPDDQGRPTLMELELTEPSLFMITTPGSETRFATAVANRAKHRGRARAPARRARPQQERMVS